MASNITRTIATCSAYGFVVDGLKADGTPDVKRTDGVEFLTTAPSKSEAYKALKAAGYKVPKDLVGYEVLREEVRAISFDDFVANSVVVERTANGSVRVVEG